MEQYKVEVTFIETDPRCGPPHKCTRTWIGMAENEDDAKRQCREWFGFDNDGIEVLKMKVS